MAQKFIKSKNNNRQSLAYGKYFATAVYDEKFITTRRILFQPETERVVVGQEKKSDGSIKRKYVIAKSLIKDVVFEETHDNTMNAEDGSSTGSGSAGGNGGNDPGTYVPPIEDTPAEGD